MSVRWLGTRCLRAELPKGASPGRVFESLRGLTGVEDVVLTERHVAAYYSDKTQADPEELARLLQRCVQDVPVREPVSCELRVRYDGEDLVRLAAWSGLTVREVIERHAAPEYEVRFLGFLPGFAYLATVDPAIAMPRLGQPRTRVPRNAVGIAGERTGVYPIESPGGWNLVGRVEESFVAFELSHGAFFQPGMRVRFVPVKAASP